MTWSRVICASVLICATLAAAGARAQSEGNVAWNRLEAVALVSLHDMQQGPTAQSMPPIYNTRLTLTIERVLRGDLSDTQVKAVHLWRNERPFAFKKGQRYLVGLQRSRGGMQAVKVEPATDEAIAVAETACRLLPGWSISCGELNSPWASLGKGAWTATLPAGTERGPQACAVTERPALPAGAALQWSAKPVPPKKEIQWVNPDGDGEYELTLTNPTDKPVVVPALLTQGGKTLWEESVVILCGEGTYAAPGAKVVKGEVTPLTLQPGESVTGSLNILALKGPPWPEGGSRVEFIFCLGEKTHPASFYYMARHHDALRAKASQ
jgi:hypothetical protein